MSLFVDCELLEGDCEVLRIDCKCLRVDFVCLWVCVCVGWGLFCDNEGVLGVKKCSEKRISGYAGRNCLKHACSLLTLLNVTLF